MDLLPTKMCSWIMLQATSRGHWVPGPRTPRLISCAHTTFVSASVGITCPQEICIPCYSTNAQHFNLPEKQEWSHLTGSHIFFVFLKNYLKIMSENTNIRNNKVLNQNVLKKLLIQIEIEPKWAQFGLWHPERSEVTDSCHWFSHGFVTSSAWVESDGWGDT